MKPRSEQFKYIRAKTRVESLKSFYRNLLLFLIVNLLLFVIYSLMFTVDQFFTAGVIIKNLFFMSLYFWGGYIILQALWVFGLQFIFGKNWEANQIEKFMEEEKNNQFRNN